MSNPFESISPDGHERVTAEYQAKVDEVRALSPTGDPVADVRSYDRIANQGGLESLLTSKGSSLRCLVSMRHGQRQRLTESSDVNPYRIPLLEAQIEVATRILDYYGIHADDHHEFDQRYPDLAAER